MKVAAIQHDIAWEDAPATRAMVAPMIAQAASEGSRLVVLAEMFATGFSMNTQAIAEPVGGPNETFLQEQARLHGIWTLGSVAQWSEDGRARNTAILAGPSGQLHRYHKIHPFSFAGEDQFYVPGTEFCTVDVEGVRVSIFICYDLRFADEFWAVAGQTDLYVVLANWPASRSTHWSTLLRARAIENQAYVVGVNRVGDAGLANPLPHSGDSVILDPLGQTLAEASCNATVIYAEVDSQVVRETREKFRFLPDRR